jgi:hypothetical protein
MNNTPMSQDSCNEFYGSTPDVAFGSALRSVSSRAAHEIELLKRQNELLMNAAHFAERHGTAMMSHLLRLPQESTHPGPRLIAGRDESRLKLMYAVTHTESSLKIACPWPSRRAITREMLQLLRVKLSQGCQIEIGWGHSHDVGSIIKWGQDGRLYIQGQGRQAKNYNAYPDLCALQEQYPNFRLKLIGTHGKYWICDDQFAAVGSHNFLTSGILPPAIVPSDEVGVLLHGEIVKLLSNHFDNQPDIAEMRKAEIQAHKNHCAVASSSIADTISHSFSHQHKEVFISEHEF